LHVIKPLRLSDAQKQEQLLSGVDSVIIACPYKPTLLLLAALRYARPSAAYAVFCEEEHSLAETYRQVKSLGVAINNDLNQHETRECTVSKQSESRRDQSANPRMLVICAHLQFLQ
jgi:hypothetical protein